MKKCSRETIVSNRLLGMDCYIYSAGNAGNGNYYIQVEYSEIGMNYNLPKDSAFVIVSGKELKGYIGDLMWLSYTGEHYGEGDILLRSDRHGVICKWKEVSE